MSRFFTGDELGSIKSVTYTPDAETKLTVALLHDGSEAGKTRAVQKLAMFPAQSTPDIEEGPLIASAHADASVHVSRAHGDKLELVQEWTEPRLRAGQRYIGLAASARGVYSCTSNGALRFTSSGDASTSSSQTAVLPMRLAEWRLSPDEKSFAYGGDEVEVSVWDVDAAFSSPSTPSAPTADEAAAKKRKRSQALLPGETWRAKNISNDALSLRHPVRNTCLTYLDASRSIVAGTQLGAVRRYDTRAARKPVANWLLTETARVGGIRVAEKGLNEYELFIADSGSNLFALDTRTGRVVYGYKGLAGAVTSIAPSPTNLASSALDRYVRVHSTFPPAEPGTQQDNKGAVLEKVFARSIPTVVVWDHVMNSEGREYGLEQADGLSDGEEEVWEGMQEAEDDVTEDEEGGRPKRKGKKSAA
ncbi:hypothetical protein FA95DRAFT_1494459 [Auriscalpium vulgare]|uniref:Uncharacterized protein n=1 Tax=Auriscalpium vulgare TaxID=40419 RepID=A0ACB8RQ34_9AGAM|nr:hypothetical protein FA95DRAFT_1494459 [Auriscalpium vulgare]